MQKQPYVLYLDRFEIKELRIDGTAQVKRIDWGSQGYPDCGAYGEPLWQVTVFEGEVGYEHNYIQDCGDYWETYYYGGFGDLDVIRYSLGGHQASHGSIDFDRARLNELLNSVAA